MVLSNSPSHAGWLIYHKPEFKGRVLDAETKKPIEGAVVAVVYYKYVPGIGAGGATLPMKVKETLTDKNGDFHFPSYATLIQPFSTEDRAKLIIFKAGYGSFPDYQMIPSPGMIDHESFFSKETGSPGELEMWVTGNIRQFKKSKVIFGIVELPKLKTREERLNACRISITDNDKDEAPLLYKALKEEYESLGIKRGGAK